MQSDSVALEKNSPAPECRLAQIPQSTAGLAVGIREHNVLTVGLGSLSLHILHFAQEVSESSNPPTPHPSSPSVSLHSLISCRRMKVDLSQWP